MLADSASSQKPPSDEERLVEGENSEQLGSALRESFVEGLDIPELPLGHPEMMLDLGPDNGDDPFDVLVDDGVQRAALKSPKKPKIF